MNAESELVERLRGMAEEARNFPDPQQGDSTLFRRLGSIKKERAEFYDACADAIERLQSLRSAQPATIDTAAIEAARRIVEGPEPFFAGGVLADGRRVARALLSLSGREEK